MRGDVACVLYEQVLNLFLALLLSSFGAESLQTSHDEASAELNKLQEAVDRISRFLLFIKSHLLVCLYVRLRKTAVGTPEDAFHPIFAMVDFTGKIWFNSALSRATENGIVEGGVRGEGGKLAGTESANSAETNQPESDDNDYETSSVDGSHSLINITGMLRLVDYCILLMQRNC